MIKGAFSKSLAKSFPDGGAGIRAIGLIAWMTRSYPSKTVSAVEDEHGLKVRVSLDLDNPKAAAAYRALKAGAVNQMSFAYEVVDSHFVPE